MRTTSAQQRWIAVQQLLDDELPGADARGRAIAAANIRYFLSATAWNYYRVYFGFSLARTIECAQTAIQQALDGVSSADR